MRLFDPPGFCSVDTFGTRGSELIGASAARGAASDAAPGGDLDAPGGKPKIDSNNAALNLVLRDQQSPQDITIAGQAFHPGQPTHHRSHDQLLCCINRFSVAARADGSVARFAETLSQARAAVDLRFRDPVSHAHRGDDGVLRRSQRDTSDARPAAVGRSIKTPGSSVRLHALQLWSGPPFVDLGRRFLIYGWL